MPLDPSRDAVPAPCKGVPPLTLSRDWVSAVCILCPRADPPFACVSIFPRSHVRGGFSILQNDKKMPSTLANQGLMGIRQRLILPGRVQPSTFSTGELNFCVRDGNRWNLSVIATGNCGYFVSLSHTLTTAHRMILQTVPISSQFSVSDLLSLACFACAPLAILIFQLSSVK